MNQPHVDIVHLPTAVQCHPERGEYFAFSGRISPEKRCDRAIEIALACGAPLRIAAKVDPSDRAYFESTGFIVHNQREAIAAARKVDRIDRRVCRDTFERRFGSPLMASNYQDLYRQLTAPA